MYRLQSMLSEKFVELIREHSWYFDQQVPSQTINHICSVATLDRNRAKSILSAVPAVQIWTISTMHIEGIYAEVDGYSVLLFEPSMASRNLSSNCFNQSMDAALSEELIEYAHVLNIANLKEINSASFLALIECHIMSLGFIFDKSNLQMDMIKFQNTQTLIRDGIKSIRNKLPLIVGRHLYFLSYNYFWAVDAMCQYLPVQENIVVHDVGTNSGHFPVLLAGLEAEGEISLTFKKILGSDINRQYAEIGVMDYIKREPEQYGKIQIVYADLLSDFSHLPEADVITANDILEHFVEDDALKVFSNLWSKTKYLLLIHVPFEDSPRSIYGHYTQFSFDKLNDWAEFLTTCENITPHHLQLSGCLFLRRTGI